MFMGLGMWTMTFFGSILFHNTQAAMNNKQSKEVKNRKQHQGCWIQKQNDLFKDDTCFGIFICYGKLWKSKNASETMKAQRYLIIIKTLNINSQFKNHFIKL